MTLSWYADTSQKLIILYSGRYKNRSRVSEKSWSWKAPTLTILWCTWTGSVISFSFLCDEVGRNTFPLVVVVCHGTKTCGSGRCNLLTNGRSYCFAAWQSEGNNSACVTTGLVTRGPLWSPWYSTLGGRDSAILNSAHDFVEVSCPAIYTVKKNRKDNDKNLEYRMLLSTFLEKRFAFKKYF